METKSKRIKLSKADEYVERHEAFGWDLVGQEDLRPDNTILITLQRDKNNIPNYRQIRKMVAFNHNRVVDLNRIRIGKL